MMKTKRFFEVLILNCKENVMNFVMECGKSPKTVKPFQKVKKEKEENEDD